MYIVCNAVYCTTFVFHIVVFPHDHYSHAFVKVDKITKESKSRTALTFKLRRNRENCKTLRTYRKATHRLATTVFHGEVEVEYRLASHQTQHGSYLEWVFTGQMTQSTVSEH